MDKENKMEHKDKESENLLTDCCQLPVEPLDDGFSLVCDKCLRYMIINDRLWFFTKEQKTNRLIIKQNELDIIDERLFRYGLEPVSVKESTYW